MRSSIIIAKNLEMAWPPMESFVMSKSVHDSEYPVDICTSYNMVVRYPSLNRL
jgi:hypothetical protein